MTTEASSDSQLVSAALGGDVRAFGRLVERHHGAVVAVAFAVTRDLATAEDIAQEAFCTAWTGLGSLRDPHAVRAWLCNIARNRGRNVLRAQRPIASEPTHLADDAASVRDVLVERETQLAVRDALADVPDEYREPLVLFYWEGQSIDDVAETLAITSAAAQKRLSRARKLLRDGVASQLADVGRGRRAATVAAAAIIAVCSTRKVASASVTTTASRSAPKLAALAEVVAIASIVVLTVSGHSPFSIDREASAAPSRARSASSRTAPPAHAAPAAPTLTGSGSAVAATRDPAKRRAGQLPIPPSYELSVESPYAVSMNLSGGPSGLTPYGAASPAPAYRRTVRGRVVDGDGKPVPHAVVLVAKEFHTFMGSLLAEQGATSAADGSFSVTVHDADAKAIIALESQTGWSRPGSVPAGDGEATVQLTIPRPGVLAGIVTRNGATIDARVTLTSMENPNVWVEVDTDTTGEYEFPLLAPGRYQVAAKPLEMFAGGTSAPVTRDVTITAAARTDAPLALRDGALVIARVKPTPGVKFQTIDYMFVPKAVMPATPTAEALTALARDGKALRLLYGGSDADKDMEFHDVAPGAYTLCVDARVDWEKVAPLVCQPVNVTADKAVLEVEVTAKP